MTRIVIIGIDGLDADLLRVYGPSLPHIRRLMLESPFLELTSSFPPEAAPAWASLYSGQTPASHGIFNAACSLAEASTPDQKSSTFRPSLRGATFWDRASRAGKRVCVLNPALVYPSWPLNGIMLTQPPLGLPDATISLTPSETALSQPFPSLLRTSVAPASHQLTDFYQSLSRLTLQQARSGLELFQREPWDLFYLQLDGLDHVQHLFWRYSDLSDPTYPGRNEYTSTILDFYRLCDRVIGQFRAALTPDCVMLVVSSYGHGRRNVQLLQLNEWLRTLGLLVPQVRSNRLFDRHYLAERARARSLALLRRFHHPTALPHLAHQQPHDNQANLIDQQATLVQVAEFSSGSPFGGLRLNRPAIEERGLKYKEVRDSLIDDLARLQIKGRPLVHWATARERVYEGRYLRDFPDILFELQGDYGVGEALFTPLITPLNQHRVISGGHRMHGVLLLGNLLKGEEMIDDTSSLTIHIVDVVPTLLSLLGIEDMAGAMSPSLDGRSLITPAGAKQLT